MILYTFTIPSLSRLFSWVLLCTSNERRLNTGVTMVYGSCYKIEINMYAIDPMMILPVPSIPLDTSPSSVTTPTTP